jgi:uncharacterized membrane protein
MKILNKLVIIVILFFSLILIYFNTNSYITTYHWKYKEGFHVGDFIEINRNHKNYKIVFCYGKSLIIKDINSSKYGFYEKKNFL